MRRLAPILLLLAFAGIGSGGLDALHQRQHLKAAALRAVAARAVPGATRRPNAPRPSGSDEAGCLVCFGLHVPMLAQTCAAGVVTTGWAVAAARGWALRLNAARVLKPIDCRGPPEASRLT